MSFDPFNATLDEAREAFKQGNERAIQQWATASVLKDSQSHYKANPLDAIAKCVMAGLVAPDWLAVAYLDRWRTVRHYKARSWDDAFGEPHTKGINLAAKRRAKLNTSKAILAYQEVIKNNPSIAIDKEFWEIVGKKIGESATRAEELWRAAFKAGQTTITKEHIRENIKKTQKV